MWGEAVAWIGLLGAAAMMFYIADDVADAMSHAHGDAYHEFPRKRGAPDRESVGRGGWGPPNGPGAPGRVNEGHRTTAHERADTL